jgi:hypothetical protein
MDPGQEFDERRLAGSVFTHDGVDFALFKGEIDGFEGVRRAEPLSSFHRARRASPSVRADASARVIVALVAR